jgi:hypothetical protein
LAIVSPPGRTANLKVAADAPRFPIVNVEATVEVAEGTEYRVVGVAADGFTCPRTLYVVGTYYAPIKRNTVGVGSVVMAPQEVVEPSVVRYLPVFPLWLGSGSYADHFKPVAVLESATRTVLFEPTVNLPGVSALVATRMSPLASKRERAIESANSKAVKVIISTISPAARAARDVMLEPLEAV